MKSHESAITFGGTIHHIELLKLARLEFYLQHYPEMSFQQWIKWGLLSWNLKLAEKKNPRTPRHKDAQIDKVKLFLLKQPSHPYVGMSLSHEYYIDLKMKNRLYISSYICE